MAIDFQNISEHLRDVLLNLKHMSPMQRFNEVSKPRFELQWQTVAFRYGMEKLERQAWMIPDQEILNPSPESQRDRNMMAREREVENQDSTQSAQRAQSRAAEQIPELPLYEGVRNAEKMQDIAGIEEQLTLMPEATLVESEQLNRLYSGDDRRYVERPEVEQERRHSIEMAARIAAGDTQLNGRWQVLRDEEVLQTEVQAQIEDQGGVDAVPVNEDYVLARDGRVMYRTQLQHALERELRDRMGVPESWETDQKKILWHKEQLARLEKADAAPRCEHIYADGTRCQAPKLKTAQWCYAHERMKSVRTKTLSLLPPEDANSIMLNLGDIGRALIHDEISEKKAGLLMYNQQLGLIALSRVTFKQTDERAMVRELPAVQEDVRIASNAKSAKESKLKENPLPPIPASAGQVNADHPDLAGPNHEFLQASAGAGSRPVEAEQRSTQQSALSIQPAKQISGSCHAEGKLTPAIENRAFTPSSIQGDTPDDHGLTPVVIEGGAQARVTAPPARSNAGIQANKAKGVSGVFNAGVECAKSNGFGVEPGNNILD